VLEQDEEDLDERLEDHRRPRVTFASQSNRGTSLSQFGRENEMSFEILAGKRDEFCKLQKLRSAEVDGIGQGCQIFLGTIYQITTKYTKL
jgi:hypothetical protein